MSSDNWLELELIRGFNDPQLQKRLLQERDPTLKTLVGIATQWQSAESAQVSFGTEPLEYMQKSQDTEEDKEETEDIEIRKTSDYKKEEKAVWMSRQKDDRRPSNIDWCQGCGAQGELMHTRERCPAIDKVCHRCDTKGLYGQVCRNPRPPQPQTSNRYTQPPQRPRCAQPQYQYVQKMVRVAETRGGKTDPTPMMSNVRVLPRNGGRLFTFDMCPDTGCTKTIKASNVAARQNMLVNPSSWQRVRAVNGQRLDNSGSVIFNIEYQGRTTEVEVWYQRQSRTRSYSAGKSSRALE